MDAQNLLKEISREEKMREGNISLILEDYGDIFSDFDPRGYSERGLSDDFLIQCRRAVKDQEYKAEGFELRLLVPKTKRSLADESKIRSRMKSHFNKHFKQEEKTMKALKTEGIIWFFIGVILITLAAYVEHYTSVNFIFNILFVILEPAGWFTAWSGLDKFFINSRENKPEFDFYRKMASCNINFISY